MADQEQQEVEEPIPEGSDLPEDVDDAGGEEEAAVAVDSSNACAENEALQAFLQKNDRDIDLERRTFGIKLLFAGAESQAFRDGLYRIGVRNILVSYYYFQTWLRKRTVEEIADDLGRFDFVFLDSGGFTFIEMLKAGKSVGNVREYADKFYEEIERYGHLFNGIAEVDLKSELGYEYMEPKKEAALDKGLAIVPVIQPHDTLETYEQMGWFDNYPYIAMGSALFNQKYTGYRTKMFEMGRRHGTVFHGLAGTGTRVIQRSQFYSVDSTSWLGGGRFGTTMIFQNGRLRHYEKEQKDVRKRYKQRFEENGLIWEDIEQDKATEVNVMNALAWKQWADYIKYSVTRCYWLSPEEREQALELRAKAFNSEGLIDRAGSMRRAEHRRLNVVNDLGFDDRHHETMHCDTCHMQGRCPRYKPEQPCGYDINIRIETKADMQRALQMIMEIQHGRVMTGVLFEKLEGGVLDKNLSAEVKLYNDLIHGMREIFDPRPEEELTLKAKGSKGALSSMLASVFQRGGSSGQGSGNSQTERAARALAEESSAEVIDTEGEEVREREPAIP